VAAAEAMPLPSEEDMTPEQTAVVKTSWSRLQPIREQVAGLFYDRLFETFPEVRRYFTAADMQAQGRKLMSMLDTAVGSLDRLDVLRDALRASGRAHRDYGVTVADYDKVADALLWTLRQGLGDAFDEPVRDAWAAAYATVAAVMIEGAGYAPTQANDP
jgi:hemoglobin-like flavoprotein